MASKPSWSASTSSLRVAVVELVALLGVEVLVGKADPERFVVLVVLRQVDVRHEVHRVEPKRCTHRVLPELFPRRSISTDARAAPCTAPDGRQMPKVWSPTIANTLVAIPGICKRNLEARGDSRDDARSVEKAAPARRRMLPTAGERTRWLGTPATREAQRGHCRCSSQASELSSPPRWAGGLRACAGRSGPLRPRPRQGRRRCPAP